MSCMVFLHKSSPIENPNRHWVDNVEVIHWKKA